jgi:hypothetical protein
MPSSLTCNSRRRSLWRSPTVGTNGTARHVGWCTSASYLRQAVSFIVTPEERGAALLERFADYLQEQFFPETRGGWGQARPACPGHPHPATPSWDEQTDTAWWQCPSTGRDIARIGHYRQDQHRT